MKQQNPNWPRCAAKSVDCRKRDLVIRITDWTRDKDEPAYDVEVYDHGVYDWNLSQVFTTKSRNVSKAKAKQEAIAFACAAVAKNL